MKEDSKLEKQRVYHKAKKSEVILMQDQLSKNRTIIDTDKKGWNMWAIKDWNYLGKLLALLFEDLLFKTMNEEARVMIDKILDNSNRSRRFDISQHIVNERITCGLERALYTGNWDVKRFRMHRKGTTEAFIHRNFRADDKNPTTS